MDFSYINNNGVKIELSKSPYILQEGDLFDWSYSYETVKQRTYDYRKKIREYKCKIAIVGDRTILYDQRRIEWEEAIDKLLEVFETDVINGVNGKLYTDTGYYLECKIIASQKSNWRVHSTFVCVDITILADSRSWVQELTKQFLPSTETSDPEGFDYPFDYPFDYAASKVGIANWEIDHYTSNHFLMRVYGPCENPRILVNGYPYQVFTVLENGEYLEIDSRKNSVKKYLSNGTVEDTYNSRQFEPTIFEKIPSGSLTFNWSGAFGFDVTLFLERSEPKW